MRALRAAAALLVLCAAACDRDQPAGVIQGPRRAVAPPAAPAAPAAAGGEEILFGDLHVHTTYSIDAFIYSLPLFGDGGTHPPADACDYARWCSDLDFFSITDHAEALTPDRWRREIESARQCNEIAGDPADPDMVSFVGWEWTQVGATPATHYGHKNVIFPGLADDELPARPIHSLPPGTRNRAPPAWLLRGAVGALAAVGQGEYADFLWFIAHMAAVRECPPGVDVHELPPNCMEGAATPAILFRKLDEWGLEALVIPHGLAWGAHAPPGASLDVQLDRADYDPARQRLIEVYSGHGNSEEFRPWSGTAAGPDGEPVCPEPSGGHVACCWRAGEIMRERCGDLPAAECETRVREARRLALRAGTTPERVFPDTKPEDWLDCDQCRDCFKPAYSLRPRQSAQYALAIRNFRERDDAGQPLRFRFGFVASSDDHKAQPGTGFKQVQRKQSTDSHGVTSARSERLVHRLFEGGGVDPRQPQVVDHSERGFRDLFGSERGASFLYPGGLVAVHARGRDRRSIWDALLRRDVYGTSGPRILLWFDLVNAPGGPAPMGSAVALAAAPHFRVRAVGSRVEKPGCPADVVRALGAARVASLCHDECHNPGDERHPIRAIEVVRIRPQREQGEAVAPLIEDPWRRIECAPDPAGCTAEFDDPDFVASGRDAVYYVRALQEETPAINGANLRTRFDAEGNAVSISPCFASYRTPDSDDCLAPVQERAWSSPIFVDRAPPDPPQPSVRGFAARTRPQT